MNEQILHFQTSRLFVCMLLRLLRAPSDSSLGKVVRRNLQSNLVAGKDSDKIHTQLAGNVGMQLVAALNFYNKLGVRQCLSDNTFDLYDIIFCQGVYLPVLNHTVVRMTGPFCVMAIVCSK